jgi:Phosphotransferase enzyme family
MTSRPSSTGSSGRAAFPDTRVLIRVLTKLLHGGMSSGERVDVLDRLELREGSTFPVEAIQCQTRDGQRVRILAKYEAGRAHTGHGHRGGVAYEADVYEHVLAASPCSAPAFFGRHHDRRSRDTWLFIEALDAKSLANTHRLNCDVVLPEAARWAGRFHADVASRTHGLSILKRYDADYYRGFVDRVIEYSAGMRRQYPWLTAVCRQAEDVIPHLLAAPTSIIHGEFYPGNILYDNGRICPVDWESAALAPGELDLASLTEGWPPALIAECERAYGQARWPEGAPSTFPRTLAAARLYWPLRWLGDSPKRFFHPKSEATFFRLLEEAKRWPSI